MKKIVLKHKTMQTDKEFTNWKELAIHLANQDEEFTIEDKTPEKDSIDIEFYEDSETKYNGVFRAFKDAKGWLQLLIQKEDGKFKNIADITFRKDKDGELHLELMSNKAVIHFETHDLSLVKRRIKIYDIFDVISQSSRIDVINEDKGKAENFLTVKWCYTDIEGKLLEMLKLDDEKYSVPLKILEEIGETIRSVMEDCSVSAGWDYMEAAIEDQFELEKLEYDILTVEENPSLEEQTKS